MTFDPNKPCQMRNGTPVRILAIDLKGDRPIAIAYEEGGQAWVARRLASGLFSSCNKCGPLDLVNIVEKRSEWQNIYPDASLGRTRHSAKHHADAYSSNRRVGILRFDYEDDVLVNVELESIDAD